MNKSFFGLLFLLALPSCFGQTSAGMGALNSNTAISFGAICNGSSHPASARYSTLTALQAVYPFATATTNQMDWLGAQAAVNAMGTNGGRINFSGICIFDQPLILPISGIDGNSPNGGNGLYLIGDGEGSTFIEPYADFGSGSALISCGPLSSNFTNQTGRYGNQACFGAVDDMTLLEPNSTIATFGVAPTISGTPVGMDGIHTGPRLAMHRVQVFGFYYGINHVGDHVTFDEITSVHNYCGFYFAPQNPNLYGDVEFMGHVDLGGNAMAGMCIDKDASYSGHQAGELFIGSQPYAFLKFSGAPDTYMSGNNFIFTGTQFQMVQGESIGNALIWDDNLTQSGGGINPSPTAYPVIQDTQMHLYTTYQSTYNVTAGGRGIYAFIAANTMFKFVIEAEQASFFNVTGNTTPTGLVSAIWTESVGPSDGGVTISADFDTLLSNYAISFFLLGDLYDPSVQNVRFLNPGKWEGGCGWVYGSPTTITAGQVLAMNGAGGYLQANPGNLPVVGVATQTLTVPSTDNWCLAYADRGNNVPITTVGASTGIQGQAVVAGAAGVAVPLISTGYVVGTYNTYISSTAGTIKLTGMGGYISSNTLSLSSAYTNATTTFSDVSGTTNLAFPVAASTTYAGECFLLYSASATTAGPKVEFTGPASPSNIYYSAVLQLTSTTQLLAAPATAFSTSIAAGTVTASTVLVDDIHFALNNGTTAGTLQLLAAANGTGTLTIEPGSWCEIK